MEELKQSISLLMQKKGYSENVLSLLTLIKEGRIAEKNTVLEKLGIRRITDMKSPMIIVILDYAELCLDDDILTELEMKCILWLKAFCGIEDGDFYKCGEQRRVKEILKKQLKKMYQDDVIDKKEALMKVDLQELFGLSYDEFLDIVNEIAKESLNRGAKIENLDTVILKK
ncbi:MAG: hypothetical protein E7076_06570 [Bacteroidales bacterium]|nr:hypothetical protein [Bacteroidales bacterium]